jgi:acetaldehyde dehydrogenase (acetylating)
MDFKKMFNSTTHVGRRNVSIATLGTIATIIVYKKMSSSAKVSASELPQAAASKVSASTLPEAASNPDHKV